MKRKLIVTAAFALLTASAWAQTGPMGPGMMGGYGPAGSNGPEAAEGYGPGGGYGPGWMMGGYGRGGGYGPGWMMGGYGRGGGYGPGGMMGGYGPGWGMGPGMMGGYGPGWGMGPGMMMGGYGGGWGMGPGMMMGGYPWGLGALDLSDAQRAKIADIERKTAEKQWELMGKMRDAGFRMHELFDSSKIDDAGARKLYDAMAAVRKQMFEARLDARKRIDAVLTAKQREQLRRGPWGGR